MLVFSSFLYKICADLQYIMLPFQKPWASGVHLCFVVTCPFFQSFPGSSDSKESISNAGDPVQYLDQEDPLEKRTAILSSIVA